MCVCVCERESERERERDRERERERERARERESEREREIASGRASERERQRDRERLREPEQVLTQFRKIGPKRCFPEKWTLADCEWRAAAPGKALAACPKICGDDIVMRGDFYQNLDWHIPREQLARRRRRDRNLARKISWQFAVVQRYYTRAFEVHRERADRKSVG